MKISIVIPCYNEVATISHVIRDIYASPYESKEIIVVDDGSTDGTQELLLNQLAPLVTHTILHDKNAGKGAALRDGIAAATGDIVILQDADREYAPSDYPVLLAPIERGEADVVFGSRFMGAQPHRVLFVWHRLANGVLTLVSNMFTNLNLTDIECGYKAFRREIIQNIRIEEMRFGVEAEITAKIAKTHCRIYEVGISYYGRTYADGKKIGWRDGIRVLYSILRYNLFR